MKIFSILSFFLVFTLQIAGFESIWAQNIEVNKKLKDFDKYVEKVMKDWNAPGMGIGIVYKDRLVFAKGYGYRDLENKLPITPNTLFQIASNTKLFTAVCAGMLVEEGKLAWDRPIKQFDPSIQFSSEVLNNQVTLRDMLAHRVGITRHDMIWYKSDFTRQELFERLKYLQPLLSLRQGFLYNNLLYMGVGAVIEHLSGKTWEDFVKERIFTPLKMTHSMFTIEEMEKQADFAFPYYEKRDTNILAKYPFYREFQGVGPCGSIISNIQDLSQWLITLLNEGRFEGNQLISSKLLSETMQPAMPIPNTNLEVKGYKEIFNSSMGMGRRITSYKGRYLTAHTGAIGGFYSQISCMPYEGLGIIVWVNGGHNYPLVDIISYEIYDRILDLAKTPWHERALKDYLAGKKASKISRERQGYNKIQDTQASHKLQDYVGNYEHPAYGFLSISLKDNQLQFNFHKTKLPLHHFHYDRFDTLDDEIEGKWSVNFTANFQGEINRAAMSLDGAEVSFARKPENNLQDVKILQTYLGKYENSDGSLLEVINPEANLLYLSQPGQPRYQLIPFKTHQFTIKDLPEETIEFIIKDGIITGFNNVMPSGVDFWKRK